MTDQSPVMVRVLSGAISLRRPTVHPVIAGQALPDQIRIYKRGSMSFVDPAEKVEELYKGPGGYVGG